MTGRVSIVTGAEAGVGFEVAKSLCEAGNEVILACKDEAQTSAAVGKIKEHVPDALAAFMQVGCVVCVCVSFSNLCRDRSSDSTLCTL